ncbi:MAG: RNA polymerase sigma factor [Gemmatimonadetes bacterium]|nr:RNA polymerase sigma factor [Gemmatimonadota bacterium]
MTDTGSLAFAAELRLARAAGRGDDAAFEAVYRQHLPGVLRTARWLLETGDVDDVVQDAFLRVWSRLSQYRGEAPLGAWVRRVAVTVILRHRQRERRRLGAHAGPAELEQLVATGARQPLERVALEAAIGRLPPGAREVFVLTQVEGYSHVEVAAMLGIAESTSRSQLRRARALLRAQLHATGEERNDPGL